MQDFTATDAEAVVKQAIDAKLKANNGIFPLEDPLNGDHLKLAFDDIDFTRTIDGYGFFPDVKFHDAADAQEEIPDRFLGRARSSGQLQVQEIRIYKEPLQADRSGPRWRASRSPGGGFPPPSIPGTSPPSAAGRSCRRSSRTPAREPRRTTACSSSRTTRPARSSQLEFVDTHQPVRQLDDDGHYFACTDFRVVGTKDQIYDIDFWVNDKDGTMTVDQTKVHKVPELKDGQWVQVPRYEWKDLGSSHVVP